MFNLPVPGQTQLMSTRAQRWATLLLVAALALPMSACNKTRAIKVDRPKPTPLLSIQPTVTLNPVLQLKAGGGSRYDTLALEPALVGQQVYAASRRGGVVAYDLKGGRRWAAQPSRELMGGVAANEQVVVVSDGKGNVIALNAANGQTRWRTAIGATVLAPAVINANQVIVQANDGSVRALAVEDGRVVWGASTPVPPVSMRGTASPIVLNNQVIVASAGGRLYAFDLATGVPVWERRVAVSEGRNEIQRLIDIDMSPLVSGAQLYPVSYQGQLVAFDLASQQVRWEAPASSLRRAAASTGNVMVATTTGEILAFDEQTGKPVWQQTALQYRGLSNPIVLNNRVVVGDAQGYLHVLNPLDGRIIGRARASAGVKTLTVLGDWLAYTAADGTTALWRMSGS